MFKGTNKYYKHQLIYKHEGQFCSNITKTNFFTGRKLLRIIFKCESEGPTKSTLGHTISLTLTLYFLHIAFIIETRNAVKLKFSSIWGANKQDAVTLHAYGMTVSLGALLRVSERKPLHLLIMYAGCMCCINKQNWWLSHSFANTSNSNITTEQLQKVSSKVLKVITFQVSQLPVLEKIKWASTTDHVLCYQAIISRLLCAWWLFSICISPL